MNMFDDETSADIARRVGRDAAEKVKTDPTLKGFTSQIDDTEVRIEAPSGSTLDIICYGRDSFALEDDRRTANLMVRTTQRAFSRNHHFDEKQMISAVIEWLRQHGKR